MNVTVVPDVHGRLFWKGVYDFAKDMPESYIVFLGDYVDPYPFEREAISSSEPERLIDNLKEIVQFARSNDKVRLLLGNHDVHYLHNMGKWQCSRYQMDIAKSFRQTVEDNMDLFNKCVVMDNVLFSHAGVTSGWLQYNGFTGNVSDVNDIASFVNLMDYDVLMQVGHIRGGEYQCGGPMWADIYEHKNSTLVIPQIVGHTQLIKDGQREVINNTIDCDSRCVHFFNIENGKIRP